MSASEKHAELRKQNRKRGRPAADPAVADRIAGLHDAGQSFRAIAARLNAEGVPTARGAAAWAAPSVRSAMLTRRHEIDAQVASMPRGEFTAPGTSADGRHERGVAHRDRVTWRQSDQQPRLTAPSDRGW